MGIKKIIINTSDIAVKKIQEKAKNLNTEISKVYTTFTDSGFKGKTPAELSAQAGIIGKIEKTVITPKLARELSVEERTMKLFKKLVIDSENELQKVKNLKCNPVNNKNFPDIKNKVKGVLSDFDDISEELNKISNPRDLRNFILKYLEDSNLDKPIQKFALNVKNLPEDKATYVKLLANTPNIGKIIGDKFFEIQKGLIDAVTPRSFNPKVIKIENEIKQLGVKEINLADDLKSAQNFKVALEEMKKSGVKMPYSIKLCDLINDKGFSLQNYDNSKNLITIRSSFYNKTASDIRIKHLKELKQSPEYLNSSTEDRLKIIRYISRRFFNQTSTNNKYHTLRHEVEHTLKNKNIDNVINEIINNGNYIDDRIYLLKKDSEIAKSISNYAHKDIEGREFTAEAFAKLMNGQELTKEQMGLYKVFGGFIPDLSWKNKK